MNMRPWVVVVAMLGGCHPDDTAPLDPDAPTSGAALHLAWSAAPMPPAQVTDAITITSATIMAVDLRVVGDAAPGDPRTFIDHVTLTWNSGSSPVNQDFREAPPGRYSRVVFTLDGMGAPSLEVTGTVVIDQAPAIPYRLRTRGRIPIAIAVDAELGDRVDATVGVRVDLAKLVTSIDLRDLPIVNGERLLDTGDAQLDHFEAELGDGFEPNQELD